MYRYVVNSRLTTLLLLIAASFSIPAALTTAQQGVAFPVLTSMAAIESSPGLMVVRGEQFTPGGKVFIAIQDPWGERLYETRWTSASETTFDMLGHDDPALGFRPGGTVNETFDHLCGQQVMVRAYDEATGRWSDVLDSATACQG